MESESTQNTSQPPFKRYRKDESADPTNPNPSLVIHIRNLNPRATEADLIEALSHFGPIAYATCMPNKRMALVEFEQLEAARKCVVFAQSTQIEVAGQPALFNYSTSEVIQRIGLESEVPNKILVLQIYNATYPVTLEVIHQICTPHGSVLRIAMIKKVLLQALVEFDSIDSARKAKHAMNGADIYSGCCTLKVEFAKPDLVKVERNDDSQWDYTRNDIAPPSGRRAALLSDDHRPPTKITPRMGPPMTHAHGSGHHPRQPSSQLAYDDQTYNDPKVVDRRYPSAGMLNRQSDYRPMTDYAPSNDYARFMGYDRYEDGKPSRDYFRAEYGGLTFSRDADYTRDLRGGAGGHQYKPPRPSVAFNYGYTGYHGEIEYHRENPTESCVVMIYGVNHDDFNCDRIFNLLCGYGNCLKVKFMQIKQDTCMAEMSSPREVASVIKFLKSVRLFGCQLTMRPSKQPVLRDIHDPFDLPNGQPSYKDYSASRNHRFTNPENAAKNRLVHPSSLLHWFNTPPTMDEERMKKIFEAKGVKVPKSYTAFNTRSERSASGLVEFESVEEAAEALVRVNHTPIPEIEGKPPYLLKMAFGGGR